MKYVLGNRYFGSLIGLCLFAGLGFSGFGAATAMGQTSKTTPPKVLVVQREFLKPGRSGSQHQKTESAFVEAFTQAKSPSHYLAMDSLTGKSRTLFFLGYDAFANWQNDLRDLQKDPTLAAAVDSAVQADGKLLSSFETSVFVFRDDLSVRAPVNIPLMRYMEITMFTVRPGHRHDFETLSKMYGDAFQKAVPNAHWAAYEAMYGAKSGGKYIFITPMRSLTEVDEEMASDKQFASVMSADQMKKMADLSAAAIESSEMNVFMFNPKMSYPPDKWKTVDPGFWGQK
jgi:hypothetical protein